MKWETYQRTLSLAIYDLESWDETPHFLSKNLPLDYAKGIEIYRLNLFAALSKSLSINYKVCSHLVGKESFNILCKKYIISHPARSPNLNRFGGDFPKFIENHLDPDLLISFPWITDLANFEWKWNQVYCQDKMAKIGGKILTKSLLLREFQFDLLNYWNSASERDESAKVKELPPPQEKKTFVFFSHKDGRNQAEVVDGQLYLFVEGHLQGLGLELASKRSGIKTQDLNKVLNYLQEKSWLESLD